MQQIRESPGWNEDSDMMSSVQSCRVSKMLTGIVKA